jgi:RyR domain
MRRTIQVLRPAGSSFVAYQPKPIDTTNVVLPEEVLALIERLAENTHDTWSQRRLADGWTYGPCRDDVRKQHPSLVPYAELSEAEKEYDRATALQALKAVVALGYRIVRDVPAAP